jgi:hypothetical protein
VHKGRAGLVALLVACVAIGVGLRLESVRHKHTPSHDESISFIAASCHQDAYDREAPVGQTVPASQWQRLWTVGDAKFCFAAIGRGLAHTDLHPPLYFWLLHVWSLIFGIGLTQGVWLNCLIVALTALALFGLGRTAFRNDWQAGLLAALWVLSPATVAISTEARHYDLFALVTVLFAWQVIRMRTTRRRRDIALLALATAAGMLTHYLFALVIVGALVLAGLRRRFVVTAGAVLGGLVLFVVLHPGFTESLDTARNRGSGASGLGDRLDRVLNTLGGYVTGHAVRHGTVVAIAMLLVFAAFVVLRRRAGEWELPFLALWIGGGIALLYLAGLSPGHAMGVSYLAPAWPFFGAVAILLLRDVRVLGLAVVLMLAAGVVSAHKVDSDNARLPDPQRLVRGSDPILLDTVKRGFVPPALWHVRADRPVLADEEPAEIRPPLLYISASRTAQKRILPTLGPARLRGRIVLWDPENAVGGTTERVFSAAP